MDKTLPLKTYLDEIKAALFELEHIPHFHEGKTHGFYPPEDKEKAELSVCCRPVSDSKS